MRRVLLKLSGEALGGASGAGIRPEVLEHYCTEIREAAAQGLEVAVVLGGGNLFRGAALASAGMDRVIGDRMGMLATVMNALALGSFLTRHRVKNRVFAAVAIPGIVDGYERNEVLQTMAEGQVAILSGGTGNPYFTTDTAACLRGIELGVDAVLKGTKVDGIYSADPKTDPSAQRFEEITFDEILQRKLGIMDLTAIVLCQENDMPLIVFDAGMPGALTDLACGRPGGTKVVHS